MKRFTKYILTAILCAAIILSVIIPAAAPVKAAVISGKTGVGMAEWALKAYREKWDYKYGGSSVGAVDCSGLIRSYCNGKGGGAKALLDAASVKGGMSTIPRVHGLGLWLSGHAGVYVGKDENGVDMAVDARNSAKDMQYGKLHGNAWPVWVKWFKIDMVSYPTTGWYEFDDNIYYYHNGEFVVGEFTVDGVTYDFGKSGACKGIASNKENGISTVKIIRDNINIRSGAGTSNQVIERSKTGVYTCLGTKTTEYDTWYNIVISENRIGWVCGDYIEPYVEKVIGKLRVTGKQLNVRCGIGANTEKITVVSENNEYEYTDMGKDSSGTAWYKIKISKDVSGWVCGSYVELKGGEQTKPSDTTTTAKPTTTTTTTTTAKTVKKGTITASPVNIRKGAGASYAKVTSVNKGYTFTITGQKTVSGSVWYSFVRNGATVWVKGQFVKVTTSIVTTTTAKPTTTTTTKPTTAQTVKKGTITASVVNVRKGAGTSYAKVTSVNKGYTFTITGQKTVSDTVWYSFARNGATVWVSGQYVKVTTSSVTTTTAKPTTTTTTKPTTAQTVKKGTINASPVNIRKGAGASYAKVTSVNKGYTFTITGQKTVSGSVWYSFVRNGATVWVKGQFVKVTTSTVTTTTAKPTTTTTTKPTTAQKKISITGKVVNVRKGAGTGYAVVTTVKKDSTYTYTETKTVSGTVWYKITVGGKTGWVIGTYAKKV